MENFARKELCLVNCWNSESGGGAEVVIKWKNKDGQSLMKFFFIYKKSLNCEIITSPNSLTSVIFIARL